MEGTTNIICASTWVWLALYSLSLSSTSLTVGEYEARTYKGANFVLTRGMWGVPGPQHSRTSLASE